MFLFNNQICVFVFVRVFNVFLMFPFNVSLQCLFVFLFNALLRFNSMRSMYKGHVLGAHVTVMEMMLMY